MLWGEGNTPFHMEQPSLNQKQREIFMRLLEDAKTRATANLVTDSGIRARVRIEITPKLAKDCGAVPIAKKVRKLQAELKNAEKALGDLGFRCNEEKLLL